MSVTRPPPDAAEARFRRLYEAHYEGLLAYAYRRCGDLADAHDVAADTFLVLWRRLADAPVDHEVPLWLYGVARRVLANRYRTKIRAERLTGRLAQVLPDAPDTEERAAQRETADAVLRALRRLDDDDRELLLLAAWERLSAGELGTVLGCSPNAASIRLHRARKRLTEVFGKEHQQSGHERTEWMRRPPRKGRT